METNTHVTHVLPPQTQVHVVTQAPAQQTYFVPLDRNTYKAEKSPQGVAEIIIRGICLVSSVAFLARLRVCNLWQASILVVPLHDC